MPADSQAIIALNKRKAEVEGLLQNAQNNLNKAQQDVTTYTASVAQYTDELADIDASIAATEAL